MRYALFLLPAHFLAGCAVPNTADMRQTEPDTSITVDAPIGCLYDSGVEQASSYVGVNRPRMSWHIYQTGDYAWIRTGFAILELEAQGPQQTRITLTKASDVANHSQANGIVDHLKDNPCQR